MTEPKTPKAPRTTRANRRQQKVEVPGSDEVKPEIRPDIADQTEAVQQAALEQDKSGINQTMAPELVEQISEAQQKGLVNTHQRKQPQLGDEWAGMVLTEDGWISKEAHEQEKGK